MNDVAASGEIKIATVVLTLRVENNRRLLRGKQRAIEGIERHVLAPCKVARLEGTDRSW
jgi:hypothetical protein